MTADILYRCNIHKHYTTTGNIQKYKIVLQFNIIFVYYSQTSGTTLNERTQSNQLESQSLPAILDIVTAYIETSQMDATLMFNSIIERLASGETPLDATQNASLENSMTQYEEERLVEICCGENPRSRESSF